MTSIALVAVAEAIRAKALHAPYNSAHEAYGVLAEEFREFETEVFKRNQNKQRMRDELIQVAAVAIRTILEVCDK